MIVVQTPLRISFFGGGTDFPSYFEESGGVALSTAIDKFIYLIIKERFDDCIRVGYTKTELVDSLDDIQHELIREALRKTGIYHGVEVTTMADIPSAGSGLGSSSAVTVGALNAMYTYRGELVPAETLARQACEIEVDTLHKPIGYQDQYICAYGGFRFFEFKPNGHVLAEKVAVEADLLRELNENLLLFYTGITRLSKDILQEQKDNVNHKQEILKGIKEIAYCARQELISGQLDAFGARLHESWLLKKQLASQVSNPVIDDLYQTARQAGALGGKITGAGGGGFLLLYCRPEKKAAIRAALSALSELPFRFERDGCKVLFNYRRA